MSRFEQFKEKLAKKQRTFGTTISNIAWSGVVQTIATYPFDFVVFDLEHGTLNTESIEEMLRICRLVDLPSIVRIPDCVRNYISKTLDMGADGIIIPRVESLNQIEDAILASRYYPRGRKGCGGFSNFRPDDISSTEKYSDNRLLFLQIESIEGETVLPEILDRYGHEITGVLIGPYDSSIMLGTPLNIESNVMTDYIRRVFTICKNYGKACGSFVDGASMIERYKSLGADIFWTGTEVSLLSEALNNLCEMFSKKE